MSKTGSVQLHSIAYLIILLSTRGKVFTIWQRYEISYVRHTFQHTAMLFFGQRVHRYCFHRDMAEYVAPPYGKRPKIVSGPPYGSGLG